MKSQRCEMCDEELDARQGCWQQSKPVKRMLCRKCAEQDQEKDRYWFGTFIPALAETPEPGKEE